VILLRTGCRLAPVLCVRVSTRSNSVPPKKLGLVDDGVAGCFREERLGPANDADARTAAIVVISQVGCAVPSVDASRLVSGADAETSASAVWWPIRRRRPVRGSDGTPPSES
jgi:hypothetical protein